MNTVPNRTKHKAQGPRSMLAKERIPRLAGDVSYITIPNPSSSTMNSNRPVSSLIRSQLQHLQHAESARLPKEKRDGRRPEDIGTEAEAASYIAKITNLLHPQGRKRSRSRPPS